MRALEKPIEIGPRTRAGRAARVAAALAIAGCAAATSGVAPPTMACLVPSDGDLQRIDACVETSDSRHLRLVDEALRRVDFEGRPWAPVYFDRRTGYVGRDGALVETFTYDNAPDDFVEDRARIRSPEGKIGFVDSHLEVVIPPTLDFAQPFRNGTAAYCVGCRIENHGEHSAVVGGAWGRIDTRGAVVVPPTERP